MILTNQQFDLLNRCIGGGPINEASIVIFGNELGTADGGTTEQTIKNFEIDWTKGPMIQTGEGFVSLNIGTPPASSTFLRFISRLALALRHKEDRFFDELTNTGKVLINNYITTELYRTDTAIINLKPLPQSTERHWDYENINEKEYHKQYNFGLKKRPSDTWSDLRLQSIKSGFELAKNSLILGSGNKQNKKAFLETIFPSIKFEEISLSDKNQIYAAKNPKVILSNYYDYRNGIKLSGLKEIYHFILSNNLY